MFSTTAMAVSGGLRPLLLMTDPGVAAACCLHLGSEVSGSIELVMET